MNWKRKRRKRRRGGGGGGTGRGGGIWEKVEEERFGGVNREWL